ncbi:GntR family transcriptional regulator [Streptomyces chilikensis]|uniref:GntR family transcriptional regulator n=1 Tax=Streptomyces chilikensis TaxID=1194079 RepID=A0ABV3ETE4_9ACTN
MARAETDPTDPLVSLGLGVDRGSPVPLYFQLAEQLRAAIEQGRLAPGALLGNEVAFAARLGLSRPTVRQALRTLVDQGLLVRRKGVGTRVVPAAAATGAGPRPALTSLHDELDAAGRRPATRVLESAVVAAPADVARALGVEEGAEVRRLERLRLADGEPLAVLRSHLPLRAPLPPAAELEAAGLFRLLRAAGVVPHSARQRVGARGATESEARLLDEREGAPLLTLWRVVVDATGRAVECADHAVRPTRWVLDQRLLAPE